MSDEQKLEEIRSHMIQCTDAILRATGSYGAFDEPGSVNIAREALAAPAQQQPADATAERNGGMK